MLHVKKEHICAYINSKEEAGAAATSKLPVTRLQDTNQIFNTCKGQGVLKRVFRTREGASRRWRRDQIGNT
ncbi:hypothetical protein SK128_027084, partial [Halocaridina rubra]